MIYVFFRDLSPSHFIVSYYLFYYQVGKDKMNKILICSFLFCNVLLVNNIINVYASISEDFIHTIILQFKCFKQIKIQNSKIHIRHCLLYEFQMGHSTTQATYNICRALGPGSVSQPMAHRWFKRFSPGNSDL